MRDAPRPGLTVSGPVPSGLSLGEEIETLWGSATGQGRHLPPAPRFCPDHWMLQPEVEFRPGKEVFLSFSVVLFPPPRGLRCPQDRTWGFGVPLGFRLPPSPPPRRPRRLPTPASFTPSQPPPRVAVPRAARQEAGGTSRPPRGARPALLASRVGPLGVSAGGTVSGRPRPVPEAWWRGRPPACDRPRARATATRSAWASARVPWAARVRETHAPRGAPHRGPAPRRRVSGAPSRPRGARRAEMLAGPRTARRFHQHCAKLWTWALKAQCRGNLIARGGGRLFARTETIPGVKLEPLGAS